ncbi:hypothetical protein CcaverHIS002_0503600 [Cutaneotrichosporon cavernicola]|uniref:Ribosomal protein L2 C-terminal domain-containing protein n=1 Tax=Cutaneotrichosporon cavernicola TaxID=279322 RepID=A0AA48QWR9_9TREE|nr:uncharacterized protein CcaverHIS019_0504170 [Cutaneotrichosporon cavernicola]BEI84959.1 hypothetical protein CcaverHIS002_0503600 [Cutaneotrichosporon cavernicola]BEI92789.1 hypothetical protein CcaverHIS019_0504170 [Cutaneotrichosporon cavernicola]BEJ00565.1 hypothetical protein CcaverHIS631_0504220 [Cutaneotrichosporon cavernicola]BEJ08333.1 hypothetical protein CcaverHIS641_0504180 [Cutaneotrichosporon cavernicola]
MLPRTACRALRPVASTSRLALAPRLTPAPRFARFSTETTSNTAEVDDLFLGPPPPKQNNDAVMKRFTGPGFPRIPGLRHLVLPFHPHLYQGKPIRELTVARRRKGGRSPQTGRVINKAVGGGHKQRIRIVDFYRLEDGIHDVVRIEYDPGRSAHIALVHRRGAAAATADEGAVLAEKTSELEGGSTEKRLLRNEVKGGWSYILAPDGLRAGDVVQSFRAGIPDGMVEGWAELIKAKSESKAEEEEEGGESSMATATRALGLLRTMTLKPGNVLPLNLIPPGTHIHNISMAPDGRMQLCRAAGTFAQVVAHHSRSGQALGGAEVLQMGSQPRADGTRERQDGSVLVKLQSGEVRRLPPAAVATIGVVSNKEHSQKQIGKAGRNRWLGKRPKVRGLAMNACDHPHGGGRGKSKGNKHPRSQNGLLQGKRTRRPKDKDGNKQVVSERPRGRASKHVRK